MELRSQCNSLLNDYRAYGTSYVHGIIYIYPALGSKLTQRLVPVLMTSRTATRLQVLISLASQPDD